MIVIAFLVWACAVLALAEFLKYATKKYAPKGGRVAVIEDKADGLLDLRRTSWTLLRSGMTMRRGVCDGPPLHDYTFPKFLRIPSLSHVFVSEFVPLCNM
jgi:hypothetical protein